jgi:peptidoglycan L-alanyl-D-glutamate endopeptidase CwlK
MPSGIFLQKIDLDLFYPPYLERLLALKARCIQRGAKYITTYGYRTWGESHQLHLEHLKGGPRAAPAGLSAHNYGLASDEALILSGSGAKRVTSAKQPDLVILVEEAEALGLVSGKNFKDWPHLNWPGFTSGAELQPLLKIWRGNQDLTLPKRLRKVWDFVDQFGPKLPQVPSC